jgi:hypothetical protein
LIKLFPGFSFAGAIADAITASPGSKISIRISPLMILPELFRTGVDIVISFSSSVARIAVSLIRIACSAATS